MRIAKREPREWIELVRKLEIFAQTDLNQEIVDYLKYLRDDETEWLNKPSLGKVAASSDTDLRAALLQRYAYNRAILAVDDLMKYAKRRAKEGESQEPA